MSETVKKNESLVYVLKLGLILFALTAFVAALLGYVNLITKDRIEAVKAEVLSNTMTAFFPDAESFQELEGEYSDAVSHVYEAKKGGETIGVCVNVASNGFGGAIEILVGVDINGRIASARILGHTETAGLGAKAESPEFIDQYAGKTGPFKTVKGSAQAENDIAAITGATITSNAVTNGVNEAAKTAVAVLSQAK